MRRYLLFALLVLASCATTEYVPATRADSVLMAAGFPARIKARTVIIQVGTGNVATASDNRKAGQHQGSAATTPAAQASNASKRTEGGVSWYVYALAGVALIAAWAWLNHQLPLGWLKWRARVR